jgi:O-antigen ligase
VLAAGTVVEGVVHLVHGDLSPVYPTFPYEMHKNFAGTVCALGAAMVYARPAWAGIGRRWSRVLMTLMLAAVLFTQSRQAVIGLVAAIFVLVLRGRTDRRRSKLVLLLGAPLVLFVTNLVQDQVQSGNQFNSVFQRLTWFQDSVTVWSTDPWFGVGLRWWYTDRFPFRFQPPNAEVEVLTSAGVVGLAAFVVLMVVALRVAWRLDPAYGSLAVAVLVSRLVQGQFDLFWSAVQGSVPFVVLGLCLGAAWHAERSPAPRASSAPALTADAASAA